jgi:hypothetical protein
MVRSTSSMCSVFSECGTLAPPLQKVYSKEEHLSLPLITLCVSHFFMIIIGSQVLLPLFISYSFPLIPICHICHVDSLVL